MTSDENKWLRFMICVALSCTGRDRPGFPPDAAEAADFVRDVLCIALGGRGRTVSVGTVPYPVTTKVPLLLSADGAEPRLFWYYPVQDREELSARLADLVSEMLDARPAPATA